MEEIREILGEYLDEINIADEIISWKREMERCDRIKKLKKEEIYDLFKEYYNTTFGRMNLYIKTMVNGEVRYYSIYIDSLEEFTEIVKTRKYELPVNNWYNNYWYNWHQFQIFKHIGSINQPFEYDTFDGEVIVHKIYVFKNCHIRRLRLRWNPPSEDIERRIVGDKNYLRMLADIEFWEDGDEGSECE